LKLEVEERVPVMTLDRRLVKLALKQLLDNALKYSPPDLPVAIRVCAGDRAVFVDVTDCGAGISPEDKERIFERFYRGRSIRNQIPGSGLGLNIAHSIMQAHHGDLTVTSRPGKTTFRMMLQVDRAGGAKS
jgi:signal transduction histidine kinase